MPHSPHPWVLWLIHLNLPLWFSNAKVIINSSWGEGGGGFWRMWLNQNVSNKDFPKFSPSIYMGVTNPWPWSLANTTPAKVGQCKQVSSDFAVHELMTFVVNIVSKCSQVTKLAKLQRLHRANYLAISFGLKKENNTMTIKNEYMNLVRSKG